MNRKHKNPPNSKKNRIESAGSIPEKGAGAEQQSIFRKKVVIHYFDKNGALRTGTIIRRIKKGKHAGDYVVEDSKGNKVIPKEIRNIENE